MLAGMIMRTCQRFARGMITAILFSYRTTFLDISIFKMKWTTGWLSENDYLTVKTFARILHVCHL